MKVSVVVPAYNVENYILKTLKSLLTQSYTDYEVVVVDDGSTDKTGELCDELKTQNPNLVVIHQTNGGVSNARMNGFLKSKGDWVIFVDGDDQLTPDALECLCKYTDEPEVDIIRGIRTDIDGSGKSINTEPVYFKGIVDGKTWQKIICNHPMALHGLLFRRMVLEKYVVIDRKIVNNEDQIFNLFVSPRIRKVYGTDKVILIYTYRQDSISKKKYKEEYWYLFLQYVEENYLKYNVSEDAFREYIVTRLDGLMRCAENYNFDYNHDSFEKLKNIPYSIKYGVIKNLSLFALKHPSSLTIAFLRMHPKYILKNICSR